MNANTNIINTLNKVGSELQGIMQLNDIPDVRSASFFDKWDLSNHDEFPDDAMERIFAAILVAYYIII
jgi:hypothetical protein